MTTSCNGRKQVQALLCLTVDYSYCRRCFCFSQIKIKLNNNFALNHVYVISLTTGKFLRHEHSVVIQPHSVGAVHESHVMPGTVRLLQMKTIYIITIPPSRRLDINLCTNNNNLKQQLVLFFVLLRRTLPI